MGDQTPTPESRDEIVSDLEQQTADQLESEAKRRNVVPAEGSGSGGNVVKQDLVEAIADDEIAPEDTSGRPPAVEVAEATAANANERVLPPDAEEE